MLYEYHYTLTGLIVSVALLIICLSRRSYATVSNNYFISLVALSCICSASNLITFASISWPERFPLWFNYSINAVFLFTYGLLAILFLRYIDCVTRIPRMEKPVRIMTRSAAGIEVAFLLLTPWNHLIFYFDRQLVYRYGLLMPLMYLIPFLCVLTAFYLVYVYRNRFSTHQLLILSILLFMTVISIILESLFHYLMIGNFVCSIVMFFLYAAFENPSDYTFMHTQCYNRTAFVQAVKDARRSGRDLRIISITIMEYTHLRRLLGSSRTSCLTGSIAEKLIQKYPKRVFCLSFDKFAITMNGETPEEEASILADLKDFFSKPLSALDASISIQTKIIPADFPVKLSQGINREEAVDLFISGLPGTISTAEEMNENINNQAWNDEIEAALLRAVSNNSFQVWFQPILDVRTGRFSSAEALVRLQDEKIGFLSPDQFIPLAEANGMILDLGRQVLQKALSFLSTNACRELGIEYIEVNLSPVQCAHSELVTMAMTLLKEYRIPPEMINLEITESAALVSDTCTLYNLTTLHGYGIHLSIDDFGSGFASTDYLFRLPVSLVKIDKSILFAAMKNPNAMTILLHTMDLVHDLGLELVVEGVENVDMALLLKEHGCDHMQGFYFSKPLPPEKYLEFITSHQDPIQL